MKAKDFRLLLNDLISVFIVVGVGVSAAAMMLAVGAEFHILCA